MMGIFLSNVLAEAKTRRRAVLRSLFLFLAFVSLSLASGQSTAFAKIKSSIVIDEETGRVLQSYQIDAPHKPASLTKMMTLYLAFEALDKGVLKLNQKIRVSAHASTRRPSKIYLRTGSYVRVRDMLYATAVKSANDAAAVLAEAIAGSEARFAQVMTLKARELGMKRTVFRNASGLPAHGQITTARDMAILARAILRDHPKYYRVFSQRYFRYRNRTYRNTNRLLHSYASVDGMKTGYTRLARFNLATSAVRGNQRIIVVVLGASSSRERYQRTVGLMTSVWKSMPKGKMMVAYNPTPAKTREKVKISLITPAKASVRTTGAARYGIQVGALKRYSQARRALAKALRRLPSRYRAGAHPHIDKIRNRSGSTFYRARLIGMTAVSADRACRVLKRRGVRCMRFSSRGSATTYAQKRTRQAKAAGGRYAIQVAASSSYKQARRVAVKAKRVLPKSIKSGTEVTVLSPRSYSGRFYRARVVGMSKLEAQRACSVLERHDIDCLAIRQG